MTSKCVALLLVLANASAPVAGAQALSQRELNGFLLGQHKDAIAASFTTVLRVDTTSDGWVYRTYLLDRARHAYMSFKFPQNPADFAVSVQIAGDSGTLMVPFVGLALGSSRDALLARFGRPSRVEHQSDVNTDLYDYDNSNYSFEVNAHGLVSSIQILGEEGFPKPPTGAPPSLDSLAYALEAGGEAALQYLASDVEIYRAGKAVSFRHRALTDLQSDTSEIAVALFQGPKSLSAILHTPTIRASADVNLRVWEHGSSGWVWKFAPPTAVAELVFKASAGRWRVWEVRYR